MAARGTLVENAASRRIAPQSQPLELDGWFQFLDNTRKLKLVHVGNRLLELRDVAKLLTVFIVFDDEAEALQSF